MLLVNLASPNAMAEEPPGLLALGDSLTAGYGLAPADSFPVRLEAALKSRGRTVHVINAGISGDTSADGLARLDWALGACGGKACAFAIVELGANDALRGLAPSLTAGNLDTILSRLAARGVKVLLAGMLAPPNLGNRYAQAFDRIYPELAARRGVTLYPFFLDGVALHPDLLQPDGLHPNARGVAVIVERILPAVLALLDDRPGPKGAP